MKVTGVQLYSEGETFAKESYTHESLRSQIAGFCTLYF